MWTETLTIAGAALAAVLLVAGGPLAGWAIQRRRHARTLTITDADRTLELPELHEEPLTALEKAQTRLDAAWTSYTSEHDLYVRAYAREHGVEDQLLAGAR